jgi:Uma2 family endonuclease
MGMPAPQREWTAEMARSLPEDGKRYEVLDGALLVSPAPSWTHQSVLKRLLLILEPYVREHSIGWTMMAPADIEFAPNRLLQPDLFVVPDLGTGEPGSWQQVQRLLLVVEGLSPSSARNDRLKKRPAYQQEGVPEYWILDIDARLVERWRPDDARPEILVDTVEWQPSRDIPPLQIDLAQVFGPVAGTDRIRE